jgi:hypothetical protein
MNEVFNAIVKKDKIDKYSVSLAAADMTPQKPKSTSMKLALK